MLLLILGRLHLYLEGRTESGGHSVPGTRLGPEELLSEHGLDEGRSECMENPGALRYEHGSRGDKEIAKNNQP